MRLYGGWYEGNTPTRRAQDLMSEILASFPRVVTPSGGTATALNIEVEMAYSLEIDPTRHLWRTYRRRVGVDDVTCRQPKVAGCANTQCPLNEMHGFLTSGTCSMSGCAVVPEDLLYRSQQKLVDSMITADIIHLAQTDPRALGVVSSDDDLWPGIRTAVILGKQVFQIHTLLGRRTPGSYSMGSGTMYLETDL
jgi:hypothetical protein